MRPGETGHFLANTRHSHCLKAILTPTAQCLRGEVVWDAAVKKKVKVTLKYGRGLDNKIGVDGNSTQSSWKSAHRVLKFDLHFWKTKKATGDLFLEEFGHFLKCFDPQDQQSCVPARLVKQLVFFPPLPLKRSKTATEMTEQRAVMVGRCGRGKAWNRKR